MAQLSDKQKAKAILGTEVEPEKADEPEAEITEPTKEETPAEEETSEQEKPIEDEEPEASTFTKQFPNLKGDTPEEYLTELEKTHDLSFKEALRLNEENKQLRAQLTQPTQQQAPAPTQPEVPTAPPAPVPQTYTDPALQYAKTMQTRDMMSAFDDFKTKYPQATDQADFDRFTKASDGVAAALTSALGRTPTYSELFPAIAGSLGWAPSNPTKDAAIKDNASSQRTTGSQSPTAPRKAKVSDAQVDAYLKMYTSKTREEAVKELSEVI